jgi:hypothetical protein
MCCWSTHSQRSTSNSVIYFQQARGAATRVKSSDTAFPHRFDYYDGGPWAIWHDRADTDPVHPVGHGKSYGQKLVTA